MQIDPTISIGNILTMLSTLGFIAVGTWKILARLSRMEMKLNMMWKKFMKEHGLENGDDLG